MKPEAQSRGIGIEWAVEEAPQPAAIDRKHMEQVFVNVLRNAMDAIGKDGGTITLRLWSGRLAIEDTGCGLTPEVRDHLFTPFFTTKEKGHGIGLTLVQEILLGHGFDYSLDSPPVVQRVSPSISTSPDKLWRSPRPFLRQATSHGILARQSRRTATLLSVRRSISPCALREGRGGGLPRRASCRGSRGDQTWSLVPSGRGRAVRES